MPADELGAFERVDPRLTDTIKRNNRFFRPRDGSLRFRCIDWEDPRSGTRALRVIGCHFSYVERTCMQIDSGPILRFPVTLAGRRNAVMSAKAAGGEVPIVFRYRAARSGSFNVPGVDVVVSPDVDLRDSVLLCVLMASRELIGFFMQYRQERGGDPGAA
jgi:hypothetical protein